MRILSAALILSMALGGTAMATGKSVCLQANRIDHTNALSDDVLLVYMKDGKVWQNTLKATCPGLKFENGVKWTIRGDEICSNMQTFTVINRGTFCFLGDFSPYSKPPKAN